MVYILSYNNGYDYEFSLINAYRSIEGLLDKVREMEKNEDITLEMFEGETLYEIYEEDSADDYGEDIYRYYKINKLQLFS